MKKELVSVLLFKIFVKIFNSPKVGLTYMDRASATSFICRNKDRNYQRLNNIQLEVTKFVDKEVDDFASLEVLFCLLILLWLQLYINLFINNLEVIGPVKMY